LINCFRASWSLGLFIEFAMQDVLRKQPIHDNMARTLLANIRVRGALARKSGLPWRESAPRFLDKEIESFLGAGCLREKAMKLMNRASIAYDGSMQIPDAIS
jgi:hypothetical protein